MSKNIEIGQNPEMSKTGQKFQKKREKNNFTVVLA
jgi:hypothetical protein